MYFSGASGGRRAAPFTRVDELAAILRGAVPEAGVLEAANCSRATVGLRTLSYEEAEAALVAREEQEAGAIA